MTNRVFILGEAKQRLRRELSYLAGTCDAQTTRTRWMEGQASFASGNFTIQFLTLKLDGGSCLDGVLEVCLVPQSPSAP
jgi:hypothetical protein